MTAQLAATPDLAHLLADDLDPVDMAPRPPYEHDLVESQRHNTDQAMRSYLDSLDKDKIASSTTRKADLERRDIANRSSHMQRMPGSPVPPGSLNSLNVHPSPLGFNNMPAPPSRPRSANRDMHLQAAAALALDNTMGSSSRPISWNGGVPLSNRPTTSASLFQRPGTAYSMVDTEGKARAQLSLSEQSKAFTEVSYDAVGDLYKYPDIYARSLPRSTSFSTAQRRRFCLFRRTCLHLSKSVPNSVRLSAQGCLRQSRIILALASG